MTENAGWGLAGYGRSGPIEVSVDCQTDAPFHWSMEISGGIWTIRFAIVDGESAVSRFLNFLEEHRDRAVYSECIVGHTESADVVLFKDNEYQDRFGFRIVGKESSVFLELEQDVVTHLIAALTSANEDLRRRD